MTRRAQSPGSRRDLLNRRGLISLKQDESQARQKAGPSSQRVAVTLLPLSSDDLSVLGGDANQNQQAFRQRFGLPDPTQGQLAQWEEYDARLTAYSNKDADWPYPTAASPNWMEATSANGDPLALEGTTVAVDFNRIPRGSLIYIPALDMYAEANDTGATGLWANADAGQIDYGPNGAGRVDVYNLAGNRSPGQVEQNFQNRVASAGIRPDLCRLQGPGLEEQRHLEYASEMSDELPSGNNVDAVFADDDRSAQRRTHRRQATRSGREEIRIARTENTNGLLERPTRSVTNLSMCLTERWCSRLTPTIRKPIAQIFDTRKRTGCFGTKTERLSHWTS